MASPDDERRKDALSSETRPVTTRILVLDDDEDSVDLLVEALGKMGFEAQSATLGAHGIALSSKLYPHVVLLDLWMSDMDGFAVADRLLDQVPAPKLVALTGHTDAVTIDRTRAAGFAAHLPKPVDLELLRETIHALVPSSALAL